MELLSKLQTLSGIQFENLCQLLLQKIGFSVETTSISGDGGIDLIATYDKPFFKGKYIVQCKRYSGNVGVPIIRDLYGVVMAERANKGILITTSNYTDSAIEFSIDKNLELIAGDDLFRLLHENQLLESNDFSSPVKFTQYSSFDNEKYHFYKDMVAKNLCTADMGEDFIFKFMFQYLEVKYDYTESEVWPIIHDGLAKEYISLFDWYTKKYFRTKKEQLEELPFYIRKYRGLAQLYNFDLFDYVQARYDILKSKNPLKLATKFNYAGRRLNHWTGPLTLSQIPEPLRSLTLANASDVDVVKHSAGYSYYELLNLLSIFNHFKIDKGIALIKSILYGNAPEFKDWAENIPAYKYMTSGFEVLIPELTRTYTTTQSGIRKFDGFRISYETFLHIGQYYCIYEERHWPHIEREIQKIVELLNTLT